jgi:hypothetical protein
MSMRLMAMIRNVKEEGKDTITMPIRSCGQCREMYVNDNDGNLKEGGAE